MGSRSMAGMEVHVPGSDAVKWIEISVPPSSSYSSPPPPISTSTSSSPHQHTFFAPRTEDASSCIIIGDPSTYVIWRIHKKRPNVLELMEFSACNEFPKIGLRLLFPDALCPFAFICQNQAQSTTAPNPYLLYTLTVSGVAFLLQLQTVLYYASCSIFPQIHLRELNLQALSQSQTITSVAATMGCLFIGRHDGSICCFQLGLLNQSAPGFMHELRDDAGIGSLWGLMSRGKTIEPVQDLVISELQGRKLLFALQGDENLGVWDLLSRTSVLNQTIGIPKSTGTNVSRLWVGDANPYAHLISLVILYKNNMDGDKFIAICSLRVSLGVKINLVLEPSTKRIPLKKGRIIDVKIACNKLWIFRNRVLLLCDDFHNNVNLREVKAYGMQENFIGEQLFQDSEHSADGLIWASDSLFSSMKDQVVPFVSSIFLRRLFHPGVFQNVIFRTTLQDYNKHWTDSEFQSLSVDDLKREILSYIESEGIAVNLISLIDFWKNVCTRYFRYWCKINTPYGLLVDTSTGVIGLIRHNSLSIFRCLEDIELLRYGSVDQFGVFVGSGLDLIDDLEREILIEFLRCISSIHKQLGKAAFAIFYESLVSEPMISSEDVVVPCFLKILETGYSSSVAAIHAAELGADTAWMNKLADHKNQRKFSIEMLLSLHSLFDKAGTWSRALNAIKNFLKFLVPHKSIQKLDLEVSCNINTSLLVHSTSQIASEMFESALDILLLLGYLVNMSGQVYMVQDDISKIQLELVPMIQEILMEWFILHFLGSTPSRSPTMEDFSSQLSSLHIANNADKRSRNDEKLGTSDFTLAFVLFPNFQSSSEDQVFLSSRSLPGPKSIINSVRNFISWIIRGRTGEESSAFFSHSTELAIILLKHGQYEAVENLFAIIDAHSRKVKTSPSIQSADGDWCTHLHLLGFGLLARAHFELHGISKEMKVREAVRCFFRVLVPIHNYSGLCFRAASGSGASQALQSLSFQGLPHPDHSDCASTAAWKLHYYQWAMQTFELYNMSEGACQFALAALEQVDEVLGSKDDNNGGDSLSEPTTMIRGRLWANVFKFKLDLNHYNDAYCAIISNPDEDSKHICLRRFITVLCERGAVKALCDGELPFVGLMEKVEKELAWKAERSDITAKPNPYKLLYAFEMHRHNWRRAASYIYRYSSRLRSELALKEQHQLSMALQESLNGLSATINALNLVHPAYAWIDPQFVGSSCMDERYPNKKARTVNEDNYLCNSNAQSSRVQCCIDIEKLENEFIITSAQYLLTTANIKLKFTGNKTLPSDLVDLLVQGNFYDMAFTILLKFWKASRLERELERVFVAISLKCFPNMGNDFKTQGLMLTSSEDEAFFHSPIDKSPTVHQSKGDSHWETLELYLEKYKKLHPRLPVIVAETLLHTDPQIELPLWLVDMFKGGRKATGWGMTGQESDPASLLRLYVDYGRFTEATNLLLEYIQSFSSLRPLDIINRKKMSAVWFPYTTIERLWCQLDELRSSGHMIDQCDKLQKLLHGALLNYLKQIKVDSDDVISSAQINEDLNDGVSAAQG